MGIEHTVIFNEDISPVTAQNLIDKINQYSYVNLYFSTNGGHCTDMRILIDFLNHRYENDSLKLILTNEVQSAGTLILLNYKGPIFMDISFRFFMFHSFDVEMSTSRPYPGDKIAKEMLDIRNEEYFTNLLKLGLTKADIKKIKDGDEVYISALNLSKIRRELFNSEDVVKTLNIIN